VCHYDVIGNKKLGEKIPGNRIIRNSAKVTKDIFHYEQESGKKFNQILALNTEFHMSTTLGIKDIEVIANIRYAELFLNSQKCRTVYFHANGGLYEDRKLPRLLINEGLSRWVCCYEYGFSCSL
jgi:hypothetical protein